MHATTWKLRVLAPGQVGRHIVVRAAADYDCVRVLSVCMHVCTLLCVPLRTVQGASTAHSACHALCVRACARACEVPSRRRVDVTAKGAAHTTSWNLQAVVCMHGRA